jgi:PAS domain-containing protein
MIFDRQRRLMIFNPALTDLTGLPFDFLSARPVVTTVLDRLREAQMLPEPKNYTSWREEIAALEIAAKNGTYCETWNLPNGSTYRVTGRPHPNGAVAFLFEDISAEISLTRHFRAELEVSSGIFDALDEAMVVFSASGSLTMSNKAYARLWQRPGTASMADSSVIEETQLWQDGCAPSPIWRDVRDFVSGFGDREAWEEVVVLNDGRHCQCRVTPLAGNATLVSFRKVHDLRGSAPAPTPPMRPRMANSA